MSSDQQTEPITIPLNRWLSAASVPGRKKDRRRKGDRCQLPVCLATIDLVHDKESRYFRLPPGATDLGVQNGILIVNLIDNRSQAGEQFEEGSYMMHATFQRVGDTLMANKQECNNLLQIGKLFMPI